MADKCIRELTIASESVNAEIADRLNLYKSDIDTVARSFSNLLMAYLVSVDQVSRVLVEILPGLVVSSETDGDENLVIKAELRNDVSDRLKNEYQMNLIVAKLAEQYGVSVSNNEGGDGDE